LQPHIPGAQLRDYGPKPLAGPAQLNVQREGIDMRTNSASECSGASQTPTQPIAVAYFNRIRPVVIDHYLHREESGRFFFPLAVAAALIAVAILLAVD
jgi:hypothetical protein